MEDLSVLDEIARIVSAGELHPLRMVRIHNHLKLIVRFGHCTHGELSHHYNITSKNPAGEMEAEFSKAFSGSNPLTASSMVKRWGTADTEIEKFLRKINELYMISVKGVAAKSSTTGSIDLRHLVKLMKQLL